MPYQLLPLTEAFGLSQSTPHRPRADRSLRSNSFALNGDGASGVHRRATLSVGGRGARGAASEEILPLGAPGRQAR